MMISRKITSAPRRQQQRAVDVLEDLDRVGREAGGAGDLHLQPAAGSRATGSRIALDRRRGIDRALPLPGVLSGLTMSAVVAVARDDDRRAAARQHERPAGCAFELRAGRPAIGALVGGGQPAVAAVDDHGGGAISPPGSARDVLSALVDSASPGRNEVDSFFSALSNLPGQRPCRPARRSQTTQTAKTTHLRGAGGEGEDPGLTASATDRGSSSASGVGDRAAAGEALADVGGGAAVDRRAALEQRHGAVALPGAAGEHEVRAKPRAHDAAPAPPSVVADQRDLPDGREVEVERLQQVAERGRVLRARPRASSAQHAERRLLVARARRSARRAAAGRRRPPSCPTGSACPRGPCGARSAARGRRRSRRSRRARGRRSGRSSSSASVARASANQRCSNVAS